MGASNVIRAQVTDLIRCNGRDYSPNASKNLRQTIRRLGVAFRCATASTGDGALYGAGCPALKDSINAIYLFDLSRGLCSKQLGCGVPKKNLLRPCRLLGSKIESARAVPGASPLRLTLPPLLVRPTSCKIAKVPADGRFSCRFDIPPRLYVAAVRMISSHSRSTTLVLGEDGLLHCCPNM